MDDLSQARCYVVAADSTTIEHVDRVRDRAERVAQLVRQRGEKFVLGATGCGRFAVELGVFEEDPREIANALEETNLPFRARPSCRPPDHEEAADHSILDANRHEEVRLVRESPKSFRIDTRVARHVVSPHGAPVSPCFLDCRVPLDRNRKPPEVLEQLGRYVIAGYWP